MRLEKEWVDRELLELDAEGFREELGAALQYLVLTTALGQLEVIVYEGGDVGASLRTVRDRLTPRLPRDFLNHGHPDGIVHVTEREIPLYIATYGEVEEGMYVVLNFSDGKKSYYIPFRLTGRSDVDLQPVRAQSDRAVAAAVASWRDKTDPTLEEVIRTVVQR
jgi:hypothetical protein